MALSGAWRNRQFYRDPQQATLHQADPAHAVTDAGDPNAYTYEAPAGTATAVPEYIDAGVDDWVTDHPGLVLDTTPTDHELGYASEAYPSDLAAAQASAAAHGDDRGAARAMTYSTPPFQAADERYLSSRFAGFGPEATDGIPAVAGGGGRGLNGLSVNNPDGFLPGHVEQQWVDRKLYDPTRVHDARWLTPDTAYVDPGQPAPVAGNPYTSPYDSLARIITRAQVPTLRRQPPAVVESIESDGGGEAFGSVESWVAG